MKKLILIGVAVMLVAGLVVGIGMANAGDGVPASKAAAQVSNIYILDETDADQDWSPILTQTIKTANQKDLIIDVSLECGLYTKTRGKSKQDQEGVPIADSAMATSTIEVRVTVDGHPVYPDTPVVFAMRAQTLTVLLQGILDICPDPADGLCIVGEEYVELILNTMEANSFNFICPDVDSGVHEVTVEASINLDTVGDAVAKATIGKGSVIIEEVRMIKNPTELVILE